MVVLAAGASKEHAARVQGWAQKIGARFELASNPAAERAVWTWRPTRELCQPRRFDVFRRAGWGLIIVTA